MHGETVWARSTVWQVAIIAVAVAVLLSSIVGVVDASGFDTDRGAIADQIAGTRTFAAAGSIHNAGRSDHGTAAASILARTAPDADLYLARVDSEQRFCAAVAWLLQQDVDVITPDRLRTSVVPSGLVGSSAAAPYVAGVVALQLEAAPGLAPAAVERLLETTADDVSSTPAYADGAGVVDPERAVSRARNVTRRQRKSSRPLVVEPAFDKYDGGTLGARLVVVPITISRPRLVSR